MGLLTVWQEDGADSNPDFTRGGREEMLIDRRHLSYICIQPTFFQHVSHVPSESTTGLYAFVTKDAETGSYSVASL